VVLHHGLEEIDHFEWHAAAVLLEFAELVPYLLGVCDCECLSRGDLLPRQPSDVASGAASYACYYESCYAQSLVDLATSRAVAEASQALNRLPVGHVDYAREAE